MFLKLNPTKKQHTVERLKRNGVDVQGVLDFCVHEVTDSGVQLKGKWTTEGTLKTTAVVQVSKNCAAVELNPRVSELLGYQPGGPQYLHPGDYEEVEFTLGLAPSDEAIEEITELPWLCQLHLVPVTFLPD